MTNAAVKTIPRRLTAFIGRLHIDTTAEDLKAFLSESGLLDVRCTKLKPQQDESSKLLPSVFRVQQQTAMKNSFMMNVSGMKVLSCAIGTSKRNRMLVKNKDIISSHGY